MYRDDKVVGNFMASGVGTNAGVTVTQAASVGYQYLVTGIQVSGDAAALVTIESPASTVLWRKRYSVAFAASENFVDSPIECPNDQAAVVKISASTSNCEANINGLRL